MKFLTGLMAMVATIGLAVGAQAATNVFMFDAGLATGTTADVGSFSGNGSWFGMNPGFGAVRTNIAPTTTGTPGIDMTGGVNETYTQDGTFHFSQTNIDDPWSFFFNDGAHFTKNGGLSVLSTTATTATIDMSNWWVAWGNTGVSAAIEIPMGGGQTMVINAGADATWNTGDEYADYNAIVPPGDPSGFGGVPYNLHLEGTFNAVPEPMSMALVGSALLGLVGLRRKFMA